MSKPRTDNFWDKEAWERGVEFERERIIKLLEKYEVVGSDPKTFDYIPHKELMNLIKGKNKWRND